MLAEWQSLVSEYFMASSPPIDPDLCSLRRRAWLGGLLGLFPTVLSSRTQLRPLYSDQ